MSRTENIEKDIIERILNDDESAIDDLYQLYRDGFIIFLKSKYKANEQDALDIFQDSIIVIYRNVKMKKLTTLQSSIKTYLYAVGKNLWLKFNRKAVVQVEVKEEILESEINNIELDFIYKEEQERTSDRMQNAIKSLGSPCTELLTYFYYYNYKYEEIVQRMDYNNINVAKTQKSRCLKYLKEQFKE